MNLRSKSLGNVLYNFLWINLGLTALFLINIMITGVVETGDTFLNYDATISLIWGIINIIYGIIFLIWIFNVHRDLQELDTSYPIKPGGAIARVLIPFYNIYGLWNIYSTMADYFKANVTNSGSGTKLAKYIPFYYILLWGSTIINYLVSGAYADDAFNFLWFISYIGDGALTVTYILIINAVSAGLWKLSAKDLNHD